MLGADPCELRLVTQNASPGKAIGNDSTSTGFGFMILSFGARASEFGLKTQYWWHHAWLEIGAALYFGLAFAWSHLIWPRLFYLGATFLLAWLVHRWTAEHTKVAIGARFQRDLTERIRAAHDLHDALLQTIDASKMIADDALDAPADLVNMQRAMRRLADWLGQATQEGQAVLNLLHVSSSIRNDLASEFRRFAEKCLIQRSTNFALSVTGECIEMNSTIRDEVYRIGCEAIRNACKSPGANYLKIALTYDQDFRLQVEDNSKPIEPIIAEEDNDGHFDLGGMQDRAERFGATLRLIRSSCSVTELNLTVPGGIIFQHASSLFPKWLIKLRSRLRSS
jgi:signal transduction histidine kinase